MKIRILLYIFCITSCSASGFSKSYSTYMIERAWFDSANIYISFRKTDEKVSYSLFDIEGTVISHRAETYLKVFPRSKLLGRTSISLNDGVLENGLIYRDSNFRISAPDAGGAEISSNKYALIPICTNRSLSEVSVIRFSSGIFYCGKIYSGYSENAVVSKDLSDELLGDSFYGYFSDGHFSFSKLRVIESEDGHYAITASMTSARPISELNGAVFLREGGSRKFKLALPVGVGDYFLLDDASVYSPNYFVLVGGREGRGSGLLCSESSCNKFRAPDGYSYLLVDAGRHEVVSLMQSNIASSVIFGEVSRYK